MQDHQDTIISSQRLARNVIWNMFGIGVPLLVAIIAIPILIEGLGVSRFGVLTIAWMIVGYFSIFDLGLGRALTKLVADALGRGNQDQVPVLVWSALLLMTMLGILGGLSVAVLSPWLAQDILQIPADLKRESLNAFYVLSISVPIVIATTGLRGVLEAHQRFGLVNAARIPLGALTFIGPLMVLPFTTDLAYLVTTLIVARVMGLSWYVFHCARVIPELKSSVAIKSELFHSLLSFGGWMTVSNIIGPIIMYLDRMLIGATLSMAAVSFYVTPFEIVTKLWMVPAAFVGVVFPAFSYGLARNPKQTSRLLFSCMKLVYVFMLPTAVTLSLYSGELLLVWLNEEFASHSTLILQVMIIGVFVNSVAQVQSAYIQALGRPDVKAKIHLVELVLYVPLLLFLLDWLGLVGAAIAFTVRMGFDFFAFGIGTFVLSRSTIESLKWAIVAVVLGAMLTLFVTLIEVSGMYKHLLFVALMLFFAWYSNSRLLGKAEKDFIVSSVRARA